MASLVALLVELFASLIDLFVIFVTEVALRDPLSFISFAIGGALVTVSMGVGSYLALGALADSLSDALGSPGRPPQQGR